MKTFEFWKVIGVAGALASLVAWPGTGQAQLGGVTDPVTNTITDTTSTVTGTVTTSTVTGGTTTTVTGQAAAVRATVLNLLGGATTTVLSDTGTLQDTADARDASQITGSVPGLLNGEVLNATTIGWPDQVASGASLAALALDVGGFTIGADSVVAQAMALLGAAGSGASYVANLSINGVPIAVSGDPNQVVSLVGGQLIINEQQSSPGGMVVNALHLRVDGVADVVIGSANAAIQ
jgi:hypothetical protein